MKAVVITKYGLKDALEVREIEKPIPADDEVLIKVHNTSLNDWDLGLITGKPFIIRLMSGLFKPSINIPGVDVAGTIEAVGTKIGSFSPGDEVFGDISESGFGGLAEYVCVREDSITLKPEQMSFVDAASIPHASILAIQGLRDLGMVEKGQTLLINGAGGGVGTFGLQLARYWGVGEITGVDSLEKLDMMKKLGFDCLIDYKQEDFTKNGKSYDIILDTKTNRRTLEYARALNPGGTYVTVGGSMLRIFMILLFGRLLSLFTGKKFRLLGLKPNKGIESILDIYLADQLKPVLDGPYHLNEVPEIIQFFAEAGHKGKVIISME